MGRIWRASRFESANCDVENGIFCLAVFWDFRYCSEMRKEWIWLYWSHVSHSRTSLHSSVCHADEENIWKTAFQPLTIRRCRSHAGGSKTCHDFAFALESHVSSNKITSIRFTTIISSESYLLPNKRAVCNWVGARGNQVDLWRSIELAWSALRWTWSILKDLSSNLKGLSVNSRIWKVHRVIWRFSYCNFWEIVGFFSENWKNLKRSCEIWENIWGVLRKVLRCWRVFEIIWGFLKFKISSNVKKTLKNLRHSTKNVFVLKIIF